mmetsp:Transcript_8432/g.23783  ORF Transcript_8432/g.23783 Transcript_8432/m.23783 type:complete len:233 (+) Transcript_8432:307-1005(+)
MKMEASPRAMAPYLAWLSTRRGSFVTPRMRATVALISWLECFFSTLSMNTASEDCKSPTLALFLGTPCAPSKGPTNAPWPLTAAKMQPTSGSTPRFRALEVPSWAVMGVCGMLGQPMTPSTGSPWSIRPRAMAYWRPLTKPIVPSMGSSTQWRPSRPPGEPPASMAAMTSCSSRAGPPSSPSSAVLTSSVIRALRGAFSSPSRSRLSSSATMLNVCTSSDLCSARATTAWAP